MALKIVHPLLPVASQRHAGIAIEEAQRTLRRIAQANLRREVEFAREEIARGDDAAKQRQHDAQMGRSFGRRQRRG